MSDLFYEDYFKAVNNLSDSQFTRAVEYLIKNHKSAFFPVPAQLFKAVDESREIIQVTPEAMRIEPNYINCPPEVKKQMQEIMERLKKKSIK